MERYLHSKRPEKVIIKRYLIFIMRIEIISGKCIFTQDGLLYVLGFSYLSRFCWGFFFVTLESSLVSVSLLYFDFGRQLYAIPSTFAPPRSFDAVFFFGKYKATRAKEVKINSSDEMSDR